MNINKDSKNDLANLPNHLSLFPVIPAVIFLICGILTSIWYTDNHPGRICIALIIAVITLYQQHKVKAKKNFINLFFFAFGLIYCQYNIHRLNNPSFKKFLTSETKSTEIVVTVSSPLYAGKQQRFKEYQGNVTCRVNKVISKDATFITCKNEKIVLQRIPKNIALKYGDRLYLKGIFIEPEKSPLPQSFNYAKYLRSRKVSGIFQIKELTVTGSNGNLFLTIIYNIRDHLIDSLCKKMKNNTNREIAISTIFGLKSTISPSTRELFARSGTLHLFAISGLHVGILASILIIVMRCFKFGYKLRYSILPVALLGYLIMTGAPPSATRAWLMLTLYSISRILNKPTIPLNIIAGTAFLILLANPLVITSISFIYSFNIVLFLIYGWRFSNILVDKLEHKQNWLPLTIRQPGWCFILRRFIATSIFISLIAWMASICLNINMRGEIVPLAIIANFFIIFLAYIMILTAIIKMLLPIAILSTIFAFLLESIINTIKLFAFIGSKIVIHTGIPAIELLVVIHMLIFLTLFLFRKKHMSYAIGVLIVVIFINIIPLSSTGGNVTTIQGGSMYTPVVIINTGPQATIINCGDINTGRNIISYLRQNKITHIEDLIITGKGWGQTSGFIQIGNAIPVNRFLYRDYLETNKYVKRMENKLKATNCRIDRIPENYRDGNLDISLAKNEFTIKSTNQWQLNWQKAPNGDQTITLTRNNKPETYTYRYNKTPQYHMFKL